MNISQIQNTLTTFNNPARNSAATAEAVASPAAATSQETTPNTPPKTEEVQQSVKALNDFVTTINNSSLNFSIDEDTGKTVVKVTDTATHEVIKQIPSEEILAMAKAIDKLKGLLIYQKV